MSTPIRPSRRSAAAALLGSLRLALAAALLAPAPAVLANDRDLRGTPVPAVACVEVFRFGVTQEPWHGGFFRVANAGGSVQLRCPLPVNNVDLSGASNDNDISKFRVHYRDGDGFGADAVVQVELVKTIVSAGVAQNTLVCFWSSNLEGTGATTAVNATKTCAHDLAAGAFYHLAVLVQIDAGGLAQFLRIDFPS